MKKRKNAVGRRPSAVGKDNTDGRILPLLERYCELADVKLHDHGAELHELKLPKAERVHFRERAAVRVALSLEALERSPGADIAVLGSPFLANLVGAIRARGACRLDLGVLPGPHPLSPSPESGEGGLRLSSRSPSPRSRRGGQGVRTRKGDGMVADLPIPVRNGTAHTLTAGLASHAIGRLLARVVLRAGAAVDEAIVESAVIDLSTGTRVSDEVAALFGELEAGRVKAALPGAMREATFVAARAPQEMLQLLIADLRDKSAERVAARHAVSETEVAVELERLDRYFASILADKTDEDEVGTITALHQRRRAEEVRRYQVKAMVHPLQLSQARVLLQRAEWELRSERGPTARLAAQRALAGEAAWSIACPKCGQPPAELVVCVQAAPPVAGGHWVCNACAAQCSVCQGDFCADHGIARCRVDNQPACEEHARECSSCRMAHCSAHEGVCAEGDHKVCSACLAPCGSCGRVVCNIHAEQSHADAPKGSRRLCPACVRYCEGGTNEPVGVDEVVACASCSKVVCTAHQSVCAVDGQVHCSRHLRITDGSGRKVCERHRAACTAEPDTIYASDEVAECPSCGNHVCAIHSAECSVDQVRHCTRHLEPLVDAAGSIACAEHRKECHVDGAKFSLAGAQLCPVCAKHACARHRATCSYCGRMVCATDIAQGKAPQCATCAQLVVVATPPDEVVMAALAATGELRPPGGRADRAWRIARDRTHQVVEVGFGWKRRTVFTLRHGETKPESVIQHSLVGSKRVT